jgi:hypothetical protein
MKRITFIVALCLLQTPDDLGSRIDRFADRVEAGGDARVEAFLDSLRRIEGKLALSESLARAAREEEARSLEAAFQRYVQDHFRAVDGSFRLREGQQGFREALLDRHRTYEKRLARMGPILRELVDGLVDAPEINAALARFLRREVAPHLLYARFLRPRVATDPIRAAADALFEKKGGRYVLPESRRERAQNYVSRLEPAIAAIEQVQEQFAALAGKMDSSDPLSRRFKKALVDHWYVPWQLSRPKRNGKPRGSAEVATFAPRLGRSYRKLFRIKEGRLLLRDEVAEQVERTVERFEKERVGFEALRERARALLGAAGTTGGLAGQVRKALTHEWSLLTRVQAARSPSTAKALVTYLRTMTFVRKDGRRQVIRHSAARLKADLAQLEARHDSLGGLLALIERFGTMVEAPSLRALYTSLSGRFLVAEEVRISIGHRTPDGLQPWVREWFDATDDDRYRLRAEGAGEIERVVKRARIVRAAVKGCGGELTLDPASLEYTRDGIDLLRSSVFLNPRTANGARVYTREFPDHHAARLFGMFAWNAKRARDFASFRKRVQAQADRARALAKTHDKIIVHFSQMPRWLSRSKDEGSFRGDQGWKNLNAYRPKDWKLWARTVQEVVRLFKPFRDVEMYYEVWNEPDGEYWREDTDAFLELYEHTARAVKAEDPRARVGGAAVNHWDRGLRHDPRRGPLNIELIRFAAKKKVPLDFISWHHFGRSLAQIQVAKDTYTRECRKNGYTKLPEFVVTEWGCPGRSTRREAVGMAEAMLAFYRARVDVQTIACWEAFHRFPDHGFFAPWGMITQQGRKKPMFHVHKFYDRLSRDSHGIAVVERPGKTRYDGHRRVVVSKKRDGTLELLVWETGYAPRLAAALAHLAAAGMERSDFKPFGSMAGLEEAIRAGRAREAKWRTAFQEARELYDARKRWKNRVVLAFPEGTAVDVVRAEAILLDLTEKPVIASGNRLGLALDRGEVARLILRLR